MVHIDYMPLRYYGKYYADGSMLYCLAKENPPDLRTWELRTLQDIAEVVNEFKVFSKVKFLKGPNPEKTARGRDNYGGFELKEFDEEDEAVFLAACGERDAENKGADPTNSA